MRLFIRVKDGKAFEHPIMEDNFQEAFPNIDTNNLPSEFAKFIRIAFPNPSLHPYEVYVDTTYEKIDDYYIDVYNFRPMTDEEKTAKLAEEAEQIERIKANPPGSNWQWNEEKLWWQPIKIPTTGGPWKIDRVTKDWVPATEPPFPSWTLRADGIVYIPPTPFPKDGKPHYWDEATLTWKKPNA